MMSDSSDIATDLLKDSFDIDLIVRVMRELNIEDRVEFPGGYPGYGARVAGSILRVFDGKTVNPKPRLKVNRRALTKAQAAHHSLDQNTLIRSRLP